MGSSIIKKVAIMLLVMLALFTGILTGWYRLGFDLPVGEIFIHHGAIMTGSFLGTVILIERIVSMKRNWLFVFPVVNAGSVPFYYLGLEEVAFYCLIFGASGLVLVFYLICRVHEDLPHIMMWVGAFAWLVGNVFLVVFNGYAQSILWWMAFLLITISAERLELNRFLPVSQRVKYLLVGSLFLFVLGCWLPFHFPGKYLIGISLLLSGIWLLNYDMVRKSIKKIGIHRYSAIVLIYGYIWLLFSGLAFLLEGTGWIPYDTLMHSFFLGFVFSMIMAHAPIILPGVLGLSGSPYHFSLYVWATLLQFTLLVRLLGGILEYPEWKQWGGLLNGVVIFCFLINLLVILIVRRLPFRIHGVEGR